MFLQRNIRKFSLKSFSALEATIVQPQTEVQKDSDKSDPIMLVSEYGDLLNIKSIARSRTSKTGKTDLREVKMISDNTEAKILMKQLNANPSTYFLFHP
jgi:hypothetical protein